MMIGQGPWFDWRALEDRGIVGRYECDWWFLGGVRIKRTNTWCWRMQFTCNDTNLIIHQGRPHEKAGAEFSVKYTTV